MGGGTTTLDPFSEIELEGVSAPVRENEKTPSDPTYVGAEQIGDRSRARLLAETPPTPVKALTRPGHDFFTGIKVRAQDKTRTFGKALRGLAHRMRSKVGSALTAVGITATVAVVLYLGITVVTYRQIAMEAYDMAAQGLSMTAALEEEKAALEVELEAARAAMAKEKAAPWWKRLNKWW